MTRLRALSAPRLELSRTLMTPLISAHLFWRSGVTSQKSLLIKLSASHPATINHLWDTAKPLDQDGSVRVVGISPSCWTTQSDATACLHPTGGFVWYLTVHITGMMLMLNDNLWFLKINGVTHSVGGLRSSNLVSKNLRTSSLWEMWEGSFIRACGREGRIKSYWLQQKHIFKRLRVFSIVL